MTDSSNKNDWTIERAAEMYRTKQWSEGYYTINDAGNVSVSPKANSKHQIDLKILVDDLAKRNINPPVLIRFMDILSDRIEKLTKSFERAKLIHNYSGNYCPVYPIKVNQHRLVVEAMIKNGSQFNLGLEVGSKSELVAALALASENILLICNGYKDDNYIKTAICGKGIGKEVVLVIEKISEVKRIINIAKSINVFPKIGIRVNLSTRSNGRWAESSGEQSKFGLKISEVVHAIDLLRENDLLDQFSLLHFHIGSQIPNIQFIKEAMTEIARIYAVLRKDCANLEYVDVGGGLGINYEGSNNNSDFTVNYTIDEYAEDIVYAMKTICESESIPEPHLISESGRALTAHYSVLITNAINYLQSECHVLPAKIDPQFTLLLDLRAINSELTHKNCRSFYHDIVYLYKAAIDGFRMGNVSLKERSEFETLYWETLRKIWDIARQYNLNYSEFDQLKKKLAPTYILNFSMFQSLPDCWAIDQIFPIMPIHRLNEKPDHSCIIADLTCDSDGRFDRYLSTEGLSDTISLHSPRNDDPYYIGFFLVGAYQEILGDYHNLFGDTNAVHISLDSSNSNGYRITHSLEVETVNDVLGYLEYSGKELLEMLRKSMENSVSRGKNSVEDGVQFMTHFTSMINGSTYLND